MSNIVIRRIESSKDKLGRSSVLETKVFYASLNAEADDMLFNIVEEAYEEGYDDDVNYDTPVGEGGHELEISGKLVLKFIEALKEGGTDVSNLWKEDGVLSTGEPFEIEKQFYTVELW